MYNLDEYADVKQFSIYFEELGSGSPSEVPEAKEDDDAAFEESQSVTWTETIQILSMVKLLFWK